MKAKPFIIGLLLSLIPVIAAAIIAYNTEPFAVNELSQISVSANEARNLISKGEQDKAEQKMILIQQLVKNTDKDRKNTLGLWIVCGCAALVIGAAVTYIYFSMIRPFRKLERFADKIASGDFDQPLDFERTNYFGKFTWAFDHMRREIVKARACEREAIDNNKTVIASLSHDLKTPVASITAYSEALVNGLYSDTEEMYSYLDVINKKSEEITRLTNDMIIHSIGELNALKMQPQRTDLCELVKEVVKETAVSDTVSFEPPMFSAYVLADRSRLKQLFGNLIGNAEKYAGTKVDISIAKRDGSFFVYVRDYAKGIPDEDMPFVFDKFYRGSNCSDKSGSGLGLYIVKYIAQQSGGDVSIRNKDPGLEVTIQLPASE